MRCLLIATPLFAKVLYGEGKAYIFGNHKSKAKKQALSNRKKRCAFARLLLEKKKSKKVASRIALRW